MAWYKTGSVTVNTGDTYITGVNTRFASNTRVGDAVRLPDGEWYELINTSSETVIGIFPAYKGPSVVASTNYMIAPIQGYNKETADRLRYITDNIRDFSEDVTAARQSAEMAKASEDAAAASALAAKSSEDTVHADAVAAAASQAAAAQSEYNASQSQVAASISETNAKKSETNSSLSETNAAASETASANSAEAARLSAEAAAISEFNAKASETAAKTSETNAKASETSASEDATTANTDAATSTQARLDALEALRLAEKARDDAIAAANANTGQVQDLGLVDLSSGVYPARPVVSSFWYVTVGGTVTADGETIEYGVGDVLRFSKPLEKFYKVDNTESVTSVAGKTGVVDLDSADVGLDRVDNTNDLEKPISTAVQAALDVRVPTVGRQDTTANRIVKVGDYGENGGSAIVMEATSDANDISVSGTYVFSAGGVNVPENGTARVYIKHFSHEVSGYGKQIAWDLLSDRQWIRTNNNNVWTNWVPVGDVIDALNSNRTDAALSANAGRLLQEQLQANNATIVQYQYNLVAGQLVISGNDLSGKSLSYVPGAAIIVSLNGLNLLQGVDFTATTGESISLSRAIEQASEALITVFGAFAVADHYTKAEADALLQNVASQSAEALLTVKWVPSRQMIAPGTFPLDGGLYSRATYPDAWALIRDGKVPKVTDAAWLAANGNRGSFTEGDGSTNFRVPDYNGKSVNSFGSVFIRGDGLYSNVAGVIQVSQNKPHTHPLTDAQYYSGQTGGTSSQYGTTASVTQVFPYNTGLENAGGSDPESRPINVAGVWTIRLFGSTTNIGNIDVAQVAANIAALDNATVKKNNIVGTVSQTGGVPTGAIIESGSNANGTWTKFADGRMICEFRRTRNIPVNTALGALFYNGSPVANNFPMPFISIPWVGIAVEGAGMWAAPISKSTLTTWPTYYIHSAVSRVASDVDEHFIAIGRWF